MIVTVWFVAVHFFGGAMKRSLSLLLFVALLFGGIAGCKDEKTTEPAKSKSQTKEDKGKVNP